MSTLFNKTTENPNMPEVKDVPPDEVKELKAQVALIDVRRPDEYTGELGHIAGAQLLTLDQLPGKMETLPKDQTIVFICRSGNRSAQAASFCIENNITDVYNMKGGMLLWNELGFEVEK